MMCWLYNGQEVHSALPGFYRTAIGETHVALPSGAIWSNIHSVPVRLKPQDPRSGWYLDRIHLFYCCPTVAILNPFS